MMKNKKSGIYQGKSVDALYGTAEAERARGLLGTTLWRSVAVVFTALFSGFCNAAIGAGGGIALTFALSACLSKRFDDRRAILATSQAAMIPGCLLSALIYASGGGLDLSNFAVFAIPALLGGALGSFLLGRIKPGLINGIFSALVIFSGFRMVR